MTGGAPDMNMMGTQIIGLFLYVAAFEVNSKVEDLNPAFGQSLLGHIIQLREEISSPPRRGPEPHREGCEQKATAAREQCPPATTGPSADPSRPSL